MALPWMLPVTTYERQAPLQAVSMDGLIDVTRWLLDHGADANLQENNHCTPIYSAAAAEHLEVIRTLPAAPRARQRCERRGT